MASKTPETSAGTSSKTPETLAGIINKINKTHGPGTILRASEINYENIPRISSGGFLLDMGLGGGWPLNRWIEVYGDFSTGKTAVVYKTIAANQAQNPEWLTWWLAAEDFDATHARMCGVDCSRVLLHETNVMQDGLQRVIEVCETREVDCVVIDSYPALVPAEEDDNLMGDWSTGLAPRLNNQFWRKQGPATRRSLVDQERPMIGFVINQPREKIGVTYGSNETTPGGRGKNFYYAIRLELRRGGWIEIGKHKEKVGQEITGVTVKNKTFKPRRTMTWDFYFEDVVEPETGELLHAAGSYDIWKEILDAAVAYDVIIPAGGGYKYQDKFYKGRAGMYAALRESPSLGLAVSEEVMRIVTKGKPTEIKPPEPVKKVAQVRKISKGG